MYIDDRIQNCVRESEHEYENENDNTFEHKSDCETPKREIIRFNTDKTDVADSLDHNTNHKINNTSATNTTPTIIAREFHESH